MQTGNSTFSKERLLFLISALVNNTINKPQLDELAKYIKATEHSPDVDAILQEHWNSITLLTKEVAPKEEIYYKIIADKRFQRSQRSRKKTTSVKLYQHFVRYATGAAAILLITVSVYLAFRSKAPEQSQATIVKKNIDTNKAADQKNTVLALADGSQIIISDNKNGTLAQQGNTSINQLNGQLIYKDMGINLNATTLYNTITTPKGRNFELTLLDGTKVWLNAASSLSYPVAFNSTERRVKINGEAYFEVAKNKRQPFVVEANGTEVKVLGTHFNVSAYDDDPSVKTTLLEGSVKVSKNNIETMLTPGKQAIAFNNTDNIKVLNADAEGAVAWKNGYFNFNNEDITTVMKTLARWYDIEVEYMPGIKGKTYGGTISKFEDIDKMLSSIELTGTVHFKKEGRKVLVTP